jgi:hypothetical protein
MKYYNSLKNNGGKIFMKRVIIFLTALVVLFGLVGCATDDMQKEINENKANISEVEKKRF